ncbi:MAG: orotidine-5'-phosphate decarboxylase [Desulfurococcaceae archaeon]
MLVVALDPPFGPSGEYSVYDIVEETCEVAYGYKVGLPLVLEQGLKVVSEIKSTCKGRVIVDFKLADIGDILVNVAEKISRYRADAVIAHGFIGLRDSIDKLVEAASRYKLDVILVASMSHRGSEEFIDKHFEELVNLSLDLGVHGVVVPANKPGLIRRARQIAGNNLRIYSPGIGVQGAEVGSALCAGADYEIIGRYITRSPKPGEKAREVFEKQVESVRKCQS